MYLSTHLSLASLRGVLKTRFWLLLLIALGLGLAMGLSLLIVAKFVSGTWYLNLADWLALPGSVYLTVIQMVIIPLIFSSIILTLAGIGPMQDAGKILTGACIFVILSTIIAAILGIVVMDIFKPGEAVREAAGSLGDLSAQKKGFTPITPESLLQLIPVNPLASLLGGDLLEVLIVALIFGFVISRMDKDKVSVLLDLLAGTQALCMKIIAWTMKLAPLAVFGLMVRMVVTSGSGIIFGLAGYTVCTFLGLFLLVIFYLIWLRLIGYPSGKFLKASQETLLLAFSLSSSAATMPNTLRTAKENLRISPEIAELIVPLGTSLNMTGSALYQTSTTIFLAQAFGGQIDFSSILTIIFLTLGVSMGTPGIPGAGIGALNMTLRTVGIPMGGISLILGVERLVDMACTVLNVMGDLVMCCTVQWQMDRRKKSSGK